jgi:DNA-damage-inducible protein D
MPEQSISGLKRGLSSMLNPKGYRLPTPIDTIRQIDTNGREYWSARDLHDLLGYSTWQKFKKAIDRAIRSCQNSGETNVEDWFNRSVKPIISGKGRKQNAEDYHLTRYACYLIAMNADPDIHSLC